MSKFMLILRTSKNKFCLFGAVCEYKRPQIEYMDKVTRTTFAIIRPHKMQEGVAVKLFGYDKLGKPTNGKTQVNE